MLLMFTPQPNTIFMNIFILHKEYVIMECKIPLICMLSFLSFLIFNGVDYPMTDFYDRFLTSSIDSSDIRPINVTLITVHFVHN